ncbi:acyltransferase [Colletotrichum karsti]|uniref:Acyltransferase n=1 Tax=Colletotrichum karsti TaxID=1095194 RepID=A0A9P6I9V0_9PEZI|nr:acyltransferase [Colletotrichum karsti]KAF9878422.1 acyltransferase [Colletotrichum karsti]
MERVRWLDGIRAIAAISVSFNHYIMGEFATPYNSFWAAPASDNRWFFQLPVLRFPFAVHSMVPLFLIIGGYGISLSIVQSCRGESAFSRYFQLALLRRWLRLYLPVVPITILAHIAYFIGITTRPFPAHVTKGLQPWTAPLQHFKYFIEYLVDIVEPVSMAWHENFNNQTWTIPVIFRGSCVLYLTLLGSSLWNTSYRLTGMIALAFYFTYQGNWDLFCFLGGAWLAEVVTLLKTDYEWCIGSPKLFSRRPTSSRVRLVGLAKTLVLFAGLWLMCFEGNESTGEAHVGYQWLASIRSRRWAASKPNEFSVIRSCWQSLGGLMVTSVVATSPCVARPLETPVLQYLGKISFSWYLVHQLPPIILKGPLRDFFWTLLRPQESPHPVMDDALKHPWTLFVVWMATAGIIFSLTWLFAHFYYQQVEEKSGPLSKWIEAWFNAPKDRDLESKPHLPVGHMNKKFEKP